MDKTTVYFNNFDEAKHFAMQLMAATSTSVASSRHGAGRQVTYPCRFETEARRILVAASERLAGRTVEVSAFSAGLVMLLNGGGTLDENDLVIEAFRRSDPDLADASVSEIGDYLSQYSTEQLPGIINNVKGIYHELAYVQLENIDGDVWTAEIIPDPYNAGSDVILTNSATGVSYEAQLKATDSESYLGEHTARYPDTAMIATDEVASVTDVTSSGLTNAQVTEDVTSAVDSLSAAETVELLSDLEGILNMSVSATAVAAIISGTHSVLSGEDMDAALGKAKTRIGRSLKVSAGLGILGMIFM